MDQTTGLTREAAWQHLCDWTPSGALRRHARAVEVCMRAAAVQYGGVGSRAAEGEGLAAVAGSGEGEGTEPAAGAEAADVEQWGLAGMLHDADYDQWPEEHPKRIVAWLEEHGEVAVAHAVSAHYTQWGVSYDSLMDKALLACDELTGLVMACCYVRPEGVSTIKVKSVMKKLKDKRFAAGVDRFEVSEGARLLNVELRDHVQFIIDAIRPFAAELGI